MKKALLLGLLPLAVRGEEYRFDVPKRGEVVVTLEMSSPGTDWAVPEREAAVARVKVDGAGEQHVLLCIAPPRKYRLLLGTLSAGKHVLAVEKNTRYSAAG